MSEMIDKSSVESPRQLMKSGPDQVTIGEASEMLINYIICKISRVFLNFWSKVSFSACLSIKSIRWALLSNLFWSNNMAKTIFSTISEINSNVRVSIWLASNVIV